MMMRLLESSEEAYRKRINLAVIKGRRLVVRHCTELSRSNVQGSASERERKRMKLTDAIGVEEIGGRVKGAFY